jgi:G:T-mismatch repair DNA endonuclease (very short patch repair protein)
VAPSSTETIDQRLDAIGAQPFRARFHLRGRERALVQLRGLQAIRRHAEDVITRRLAPAMPHKDGRQTPYRGHPVFVAQHATATCCRGCLERNHQIARGHELTASERDYAVHVIMRWIEREIPDAAQ